MVNSQSVASRAIFLAEIEQFGGAERSILALSRWLYRHGLAHHLVTYFDHCSLLKYATHPVQIVALKPSGGVLGKIKCLRQHFASKAPRQFEPLLSGYQAALHATLAGMRGFHDLMHDTPTFFSDHDHRTARQRLRIAISNRIIGHGLRSGGATIANSEFLRDDCRRYFNISAQIIRMGGLVEPGSFHLRPVGPELRMLSVSRIEKNKRIDWVLQSLADLEHAYPSLSSRIDWRLDLVGKGSRTEALRAMAAELGIGNRVHFHGFISDAELSHLYAVAHLVLIPSVQGYGIPAIEAVQRGIPILLHRDSGVSDILRQTPWATVFDGSRLNMTAALSSALESVLAGSHQASPLPDLPTEDDWAEQVSRTCNWV